jgi:hypothetical protein
VDKKLFLLCTHSISFAPFRFHPLSLNKPTIRQKLKLSDEQLKAALERVKALEEYTAFLDSRFTQVTGYADFLQHTVRDLQHELKTR